MKTLRRFTFLIHGFCYAEMDRWPAGKQLRAQHRPFRERESRCAEQWRERLRSFGPDEGLGIVSWPHGSGGPAAEFARRARSILHDRCFLLDAPAPDSPLFWDSLPAGAGSDILAELRDAWARQGASWNKEELHTALQAAACVRQLKRMLRARGLRLDARRLTARAWGASFEGCVLKYSLNFRRQLGWRAPIEIDFDLTVPDAAFLLQAMCVETCWVSDRLRLFLFRIGKRCAALFTATSSSCADRPLLVELPEALRRVSVLSKQGIRLWPRPLTYHLPGAGAGYYEPPQRVVEATGRRLRVPVTTGLVYRLAKAPAYILAPPEMAYEDFRRLIQCAGTC